MNTTTPMDLLNEASADMTERNFREMRATILNWGTCSEEIQENGQRYIDQLEEAVKAHPLCHRPTESVKQYILLRIQKFDEVKTTPQDSFMVNGEYTAADADAG